MSCSPQRPCRVDGAALGLVAPPPGQRVLTRRYGEFWSFLEDLTARVEQLDIGETTLGSSWDLEGDPHGALLARLWAAVAEGVAAQTELTAGEAYVATAQDWTDLRRIAALVGYRPQPRIAAQGWVRVDVERGTDPLVPANTRMQAPATPARPAQTFETIDETPLYSQWGALTATWVPVPAVPDKREVRFLGLPGFRAGDDLLFVLEEPVQAPAPVMAGWFAYWHWLLFLLATPPSSSAAMSLATVTRSEEELGTTLVSFDRDLDAVLTSPSKPYAAYRVLATAAPAKRLEQVLQIKATEPRIETLPLTGSPAIDPERRWVILDSALENLSAGQLVAVVDWADDNRCDIAHVASHEPVRWETAPGMPRRVSKLTFSSPLGALGGNGEKSIYVLDRRVVARHYAFPPARPAGPPQVRLYPRPRRSPAHVAISSGPPERPTWAVYACREAAAQEDPGVAGGAPSGLVLDLVDGAPADGALRAPASANVVRVRHGVTESVTLGSGDATNPALRLTTPDAPVAYDLDDAGMPVPTLELRVDGVRWDELPSLYDAGPVPAFAVERQVDGALTVEFGDGAQGARPPTGRGNITARYRVGGGTAGEVESGAIDTLAGSVRGVQRVAGAGPTAGGADQDSERRIRRLAPGRARAFGRVVSAEDLVDLSRSYPGVSHAAAWRGAGPAGCSCGGTGLHLAFVRAATAGPRAPLAQEVRSLSSYLDARRDVTVALCVCAATVARPAVTARLATDPRREPAAVAAAASVALTAEEGPLAADERALGQPLDRSDVLTVLHAVAGVVGVVSLTVAGASGQFGRLAAARHELVFPSARPAITAAPA